MICNINNRNIKRKMIQCYHYKALELYSDVINHWWEGVTSDDSNSATSYAVDSNCDDCSNFKSGERRCRICWLKRYNCYCNYAIDQLQFDSTYDIDCYTDVEVCIYYHYAEIGRSANTAHIFPLLISKGFLPKDLKISCTTLIHGNAKEEHEFWKKIEQENSVSESTSTVTKTCILYPCNGSISLNSWLPTNSKKSNDSHQFLHSDIISQQRSSPRLRLIILDGTYKTAASLYRFLNRLFAEELPSLLSAVQFVHLDLSEDNSCKSSVRGIMYQPGKDKICSFQAIVLALDQIYRSEALRASLMSQLDQWIEYILIKKIKRGKTKVICNIQNVDNSPSDSVLAIMKRVQEASEGPKRRLPLGQHRIRVRKTLRYNVLDVMFR